jgi:hypothetical protein
MPSLRTPVVKANTIKVIDVVKPEEPIAEPIVESVDEPIVESVDEPIVEVKPSLRTPVVRAKRQPSLRTPVVKAKKEEPTIQPETNVIYTIDESIIDVKLPTEPIKEESLRTPVVKKIADKVKCPDCGKMVSSKSLKYSHIHTCTAKKTKQQDVNVEVKQDEPTEYIKTFEPVNIELPMKPSLPGSQRENMRKLRQERMKLLFTGAV